MFSLYRRPRSASALIVAASFVALCLAPGSAAGRLERTLPDSLTDREFWQFFSTKSEAGGSFVSENFVSNEQTYQHVIPALQRKLTRGGVYLGVGPEQNFTYIANLKPRMAVIFDIRRQNAMAHLMYKAMFELAPTRADFVSLLFSRALPKSLGPLSKPEELFAAASAAPENDSLFDANRKAIIERLTVKHGFALTPDDVRSITHVYVAFFEAGPAINYGYRTGASSVFRPSYSTYGQLQSLTNAAGENMAFLATEENYQWLRTLHKKNLVVPVVGDFAGPTAIRSVGEYMKQHGATVTAFYLSNVEQYLFRGNGDAERFYHNVEALPIDSTSSFIRSVPPGDGMFGGTITPAGGLVTLASSAYYSVRVVDSAGMRVVYTTTDSAGRRVTTRTIDSTRMSGTSPLEIFRSLRARDDSVMRARADSAFRANGAYGPIIVGRDTLPYFGGMRSIVVGGGSLVSGIASIRASLDAFAKGQLGFYQQAIAMTKIDGWK